MKNELIKSSLSSSEEYFCEGFFASGAPGKGNMYCLGMNFSVGKVTKQFSHAGSINLDEINAFDQAEVARAHIGQINMIKVSSFCGPRGRIWGYDLCKVPKSPSKWGVSGSDIGHPDLDIWEMDNLVGAFERLTGTVQEPRFPFLPGSHVPCATKSITKEGPCILYTAMGCGIPVDRERNACLLMEDFGFLPLTTHDEEAYIHDLLSKLAKSVLAIGRNQNVEYKEIFIGLDRVVVEEGEVGCALVAAPYLKLAQGVTAGGVELAEADIDRWERAAAENFLCNNS